MRVLSHSYQDNDLFEDSRVDKRDLSKRLGLYKL